MIKCEYGSYYVLVNGEWVLYKNSNTYNLIIVNPATTDAIYYDSISKEIMYETVNKRINGFENFKGEMK